MTAYLFKFRRSQNSRPIDTAEWKSHNSSWGQNGMSEQTLARVSAPSAATIRKQLAHFLELWRGAMFLKREIYTYERDQKNPFANGLLYIAVIGILVALASILGAGLRYATLPSADAIK